MHTCPDCGQACYCNGDIDDIEADDTAADHCDHCEERDDDNCDDDDERDYTGNGADYDPFADKPDNLDGLTIRTVPPDMTL